MDSMVLPSWAQGDPGVLAEQFVKINGDCSGPTKYFALLAAIAAASIHNVLTISPSSSKQQQIANIKATAAAVVQLYRSRPGREEPEDNPDAGAQGTPAPLQRLDKVVEQIQQQLQQQQQQQEGLQLITAAFEAYMTSLDYCLEDNDSDDGNPEVSFSIDWPLDGSAVAGGDLQQYVHQRRMREIYKGLKPRSNDSSWIPGGYANTMARLEEDINSYRRDPPAPNSSPLAMFINSKPQAMYSSRAAQAAAEAAAEAEVAVPQAAAAAEPAAAPIGAEPGSSCSRRTTRSCSAAAAAAVAASTAAAVGAAAQLQLHSLLTDACCDIKVLKGVFGKAYTMHLDGDLLCVGHDNDYRGREPGLSGVVLGYLPQPTASTSQQQQQQQQQQMPSERWQARRDEVEWGLVALSAGEGSLYKRCREVRHGLFSHVSKVCADAGNALMWCAGDEGRRIKGFRAPAELGGPRNTDAACNRGEGNGMQLQYTLRSDGSCHTSACAGLHVLGTKVVCVTGDGELLSSNLSNLVPQARERHSWKVYNEDGQDSDEGSDGEGPIFKGDLGMRDRDHVNEVECSKGVPPSHTQQLQLPSTGSKTGYLGLTCLVGPSCSTLAASWEGVSYFEDTSAVLTFDMQTQQATNAFFGHLGDISDIAAAPAAWPGAEHLFATAAQSRDVKIWDIRCRGGAAAITLVTGGDQPTGSVVLASNSSGSNGNSGGSSSGGSQLGAGLMCFAGGTCESVWAWDVRAGSAQALYQLSTGNQEVTSLAWHAATNTLIANCEAHHEWEDCSSFNPKKAGFIGPNEQNGDVSGEDEEDSCSEDESYSDDSFSDDYRWPRHAKHEPSDFRHYYNVTCSSVLAYTFSSRAAQVVPDTQC